MIYHRELKRTCFGSLCASRSGKPVELDGLVHRIDRDYTTSVFLPMRNSKSGLWYVVVDRVVSKHGGDDCYSIWAYDHNPNVKVGIDNGVYWSKGVCDDPNPVRLANLYRVHYDSLNDFCGKIYCFGGDVDVRSDSMMLNEIGW